MCWVTWRAKSVRPYLTVAGYKPASLEARDAITRAKSALDVALAAAIVRGATLTDLTSGSAGAVARDKQGDVGTSKYCSPRHPAHLNPRFLI